MVLASLVVVSLAAARPSWLSPIGQRDPVVARWLNGPLGPLTSWFTLGANGLNAAFTAIVGAMFISYIVAVLAAHRLRPKWALATLVVVQVIFFLGPPMQLTDIFNYLNYARMEVLHGLNPYTTIPALGPSSDPTFSLSNWHGLLSPYGTLFTLLTLAIVPLGVAGAYWALKTVLLLLSLGIVWLVWRCAKLLGRDPLTAALFVGLNPIMLVWGLGADHNDPFMVFPIVLAMYFLLRSEAKRVGLRVRHGAAVGTSTSARVASFARTAGARLDGTPRPLPDGEPGPWLEMAAGAAIAASVAIKASAVILVPILLLGVARRVRFASGLLLGLLTAGVASVLAFGVNLPDIAQQDGLVVQTGIPNLIGYLAGSGGETAGLHRLLSALLAIGALACALWAVRSRRWITPAGTAILLVLLTLSWILPSYVLWLLPFAALARGHWLRVAAVIFSAYILVFWTPYASDLESALHLHLAATPLAQQLAAFQHTLEY
jgi:hypothetical protein